MGRWWDQGHEAYRSNALASQMSRAVFLEPYQLLRPFHGADGQHEVADAELLDQALGYCGGRRRDDHAIERGVFRPAEGSIADQLVHSPVTKLRQKLGRSVGKLGDALDRIDLAAELCEHGGLVAATGADLEDSIARGCAEKLGHQRDDVRLRDRLPVPERQREISICLVGLARRHELVPRHATQRLEHTAILDALRPERFDKPASCPIHVDL